MSEHFEQIRIPIGDYQVRSFVESDAPAIAQYANNSRISRNMRDSFPYPYTLVDAQAWIIVATAAEVQTNFAIASATEVIGGIGFTLRDDVQRRSAEIGYWIGEPFWGRGIATDALRAVTDYAFTHHDLARIEAIVYEWNPASSRVLEKAGYTLEARVRNSITKDGQTIDHFLYARVQD